MFIYEHRVLCKEKKTKKQITPAASCFKLHSYCEAASLYSNHVVLKYPLMWVYWVHSPTAGKIKMSNSVISPMTWRRASTSDKFMRTSASENASDVARVKDIFLRLLGMQKSCRSLFCLPHLLFITLQFSPTEETLACCQQHSESHYFTTDSTTGKNTAVCYLRAIINGSKQHQFWQVVVDHQSCDVITVTPSHFKSKWSIFFFLKHKR